MFDSPPCLIYGLREACRLNCSESYSFWVQHRRCRPSRSCGMRDFKRRGVGFRTRLATSSFEQPCWFLHLRQVKFHVATLSSFLSLNSLSSLSPDSSKLGIRCVFATDFCFLSLFSPTVSSVVSSSTSGALLTFTRSTFVLVVSPLFVFFASPI